MDWIERWLGLNPDGGDGSIETFILGAVVALGLALVCLAVPPVRRRLTGLVRGRTSARTE